MSFVRSLPDEEPKNTITVAQCERIVMLITAVQNRSSRELASAEATILGHEHRAIVIELRGHTYKIGHSGSVLT